ncbi:MAG: DUF58 domain-containing protein [Desulfovibrio sp.]|nr:MAG: DUF58 domain-containing protein [Desulfovibrio sp.]
MSNAIAQPQEVKRSLARRIFGPRDIFIMPTRLGWVFLAALAAMLFGAANYTNNLAFVLTFVLFSMAVASLFHTHRNLRGIDLRFGAARPTFAGRHALFEFHARAPEKLRASLVLSMDANAPARIDLNPDTTQTVQLSAMPDKRGWYEPGHVLITSSYPLGLFYGWTRKKPAMQCLIYPKPLDTSLPLGTGPMGQGEGEAPCPGVDDFTGLRTYQPGDLMQRIAWKASSRGQGLYTKEFEGQCGEAVVLDFSDFDHGDAEWRLSAMCRMVLDAEARFLDYGLRLPGLEIEPSRGEEHKSQCLKALALFQ